MTEIEKQALALVNEVYRDQGETDRDWAGRNANPVHEALCRAIEQHEAYKREVSEALTSWYRSREVPAHFERFILTKPVDPLVEALNDMKDGRPGPTTKSYAACLRAALAARGWAITETKE